MNVQFFHPDGEQIFFQQADTKKYRGTLLPGSKVQQGKTWAAAVTVQEFQSSLFRVGHRLMEFFSKINFSIKEPAGLRLEALLSGEMYVSINDEKRKFRAGEYRITNDSLFKALFKKDTSCSFFILHYSNEFFEKLGLKIAPNVPQQMPDAMVNLINEMLGNPYSEQLRDFYYENCARELLFFHLAQNSKSSPGVLFDKDVALIYKADSLIGSNLQKHHSIQTLARIMNTNSLKLKTGFNKVFGMGVFERLLFRRMEKAKLLLETTNKPVYEIASLTGYSSTAAFINVFRKNFGLTPREWRVQAIAEYSDANDFLIID